MRLALIVCMNILAANVAFANEGVANYCAAFARDDADRTTTQKQDWQKRYDSALQTCTEQFSAVTTAPAPTRKKAVKVVTKPTPVPAKPEKKTAPAPSPPAPVKIRLLKEGTPEWQAYCKSKYVSFNVETGNYLSKTGIERKCLVTAD
jgi:hypothetical protein